MYTGAQSRTNTGYTQVIIEIVGRNHPPQFERCAEYSSEAQVPEETRDAFVIQVCAADYLTQSSFFNL